MYQFRKDHLKLIAKTQVRYSIRGGSGIVFVFMSLMAGLIIASIFIDPIEQMRKEAKAAGQEAKISELVDEVVQKVGRPAIKWVLDTDDAQADYLVVTKPALVSCFLLVLFMFLPFLISFGSFNQLSGDISNKGLRYQLLRTERANIFMGRFLGTYLFTLITLLVLVAVVTLYLVFKADFYPSGDVIVWMFQGFVAMALYALPWVALCAWISSAIDSPFGSLVVSQLIIGFWPLLIMFAKSVESGAAYGNYLLPWGFKYWLFHPSVGQWIAGAGAMFAFTGLFLFLGLRGFQTRDL